MGIVKGISMMVTHYYLSNDSTSNEVRVDTSQKCLPCSSYDVTIENLVLGSISDSLFDMFLYLRHLPALYCIYIVRGNSVSVTHGS